MSNQPRRILVATLALLAGMIPCALSAQILLPTTERRAVEFGYAYKWFERDATSGPLERLEWETASLYGRYGALDRMTIHVEGGLWSVDDPDIEDRTFTRWVVGGGASVDVLRRGKWGVAAAASFNEVYDHDNDYLTDQRTRSWNAALWAQCRLGAGRDRMVLWAGPVYVDDIAEFYPWGGKDPVSADTDNTVGALAGVSGVLFRYVTGFASVTYVEHAQLRLGIAVRSRGVEP